MTKMQAGDIFVFSWVAKGGVVNFDMHGKKPNDGDKRASYWIDRDKATAASRRRSRARAAGTGRTKARRP